MSSYLKFQHLPYTKTQLHSPEDFNIQGILATENEFSSVRLIKVSYRFSWEIYSRRYATEICTLTKELIWNPSNNFDIFSAVQKDRTKNKTSNSLTCSKRDECAVCSSRLQTKSSISICYKLFSELESHTHIHTHTSQHWWAALKLPHHTAGTSGTLGNISYYERHCSDINILPYGQWSFSNMAAEGRP